MQMVMIIHQVLLHWFATFRVMNGSDKLARVDHYLLVLFEQMEIIEYFPLRAHIMGRC